MTTEVTLQLPEKVYQQATRLAQLTNRDVGGLLTETIELGLSPLGPSEAALKPVSELSDEEVLATADLGRCWLASASRHNLESNSAVHKTLAFRAGKA